MLKVLLNLIFGILPEILFIWYVVTTSKNTNKHKLLLLILIAVSYVLCGTLVNFTYDHQYLVYVLMSVLIFISSKITNKKTNILDLFVSYYSIMYINFVSLFTIKLIGYNSSIVVANRLILLGTCLLVHRYGNRFYKFCLSQWNRGNNNKIKSVTLRNILIISANLALFVINFYVLNYLTTFEAVGMEV